jgi:hypothetical protein
MTRIDRISKFDGRDPPLMLKEAVAKLRYTAAVLAAAADCDLRQDRDRPVGLPEAMSVATFVNHVVAAVNCAGGDLYIPVQTEPVHVLLLDDAETATLGLICDFHADDPEDTPYDHEALDRVRAKVARTGPL